MSIIHVVSVSGGKDSAATLLMAIERFGRHRVRAIFCDTGNEHEAVYEYLAYLELALEIHIDRLRADFRDEIARKRMFIARDQRTGRKNGRRLRWSNKAKRRALAVLQPTGNPFLDLCLWKGRFPSRKGQFCTEQLKRNLAVEYQLALIEQGHTVVSWQGVRRDESAARKDAIKFERLDKHMYVFRPLVEWSASDVFAYCAAQGIQNNPLYTMGMSRVGCMPCINASKDEIHAISRRFPEHVERIAAWERLVGQASKRASSSFIPAPTNGRKVQNQVEHARANDIYAVVEWSKTSRGGRQFSLLTALEDSTACASAYGLCE
jgi:3'-phosphoadenosine 5'-phosphosulfate sulfotransferase (PAPS reductase)/FAD synthetase